MHPNSISTNRIIDPTTRHKKKKKPYIDIVRLIAVYRV
jgi:hypothetical protein